MEQQTQGVLKGKIDLRATLKLESGLHIGGASAFAPIGAVDSPFVRDPLTKQPIIPGSSLKGKIRTLLAKSMASGYILNPIDQDPEGIARLFGAAAKGSNSGRPSRLQFFDLPLTESSVQYLENLELDTYIGEIKFENSIDRLTATANPRQIERVPAGAEFSFRLVYNIERDDEILEDMKTLRNGLRLLQMDYLGGHGSRGYGRVSIHDIGAKHFVLDAKPDKALMKTIETMLQEDLCES
ncbi:type III-A CRISPR-associated RAMP protein Csm3 [Mitsuokella sp. AF21-1AC]|uniref:type III-A CRISPR-associated RAMP protein Csm3 n=1 Tax=Mitsuokella sp. AF21-1AC TaxID=2292235 RepID=UPI000E467853|nr:type III-A CRISPR-associated RAMP protein Csm3 [Mitsuokella sp. AF21-1AC]RGS72693.1 type III-A CRISPR-associated RAMP protein Csm3 [Mitsuokella sp. AF21-1AC]